MCSLIMGKIILHFPKSNLTEQAVIRLALDMIVVMNAELMLIVEKFVAGTTCSLPLVCNKVLVVCCKIILIYLLKLLLLILADVHE